MVDRMLRRPNRGNRRRRARNFRAWKRFCPDGRTCPHDNTTHLSTSGQPHFYWPATPEEAADVSVRLFRHVVADGGSMLVRRMTVSHDGI